MKVRVLVENVYFAIHNPSKSVPNVLSLDLERENSLKTYFRFRFFFRLTNRKLFSFRRSSKATNDVRMRRKKSFSGKTEKQTSLHVICIACFLKVKSFEDHFSSRLATFSWFLSHKNSISSQISINYKFDINY